MENGSGTVIAKYGYDHFGRRLWKEAGGSRTYFFYSDEGLIGEYDETGAEIRSYGYKPGSPFTTDPLFMKDESGYFFYQNDHLGTPRVMTDASGSVVWSAKYAAFGEAVVDLGSRITNNLRFAGMYFDAETGLNNNLHRYYAPESGRYWTRDPIGLAGGINPYVYARNRPIDLSDPFGLVTIDPSCQNKSAIEALMPLVEAKINSDCLPAALKACMLGKLASLKIKCWNDPKDKRAGFAIPCIGSGIRLNEGNGGIDASVIFHEMTHKCCGGAGGGGERAAYGCTKKCFSPEITTGGAGGNPCDCK